jgi:hypothetical protein
MPDNRRDFTVTNVPITAYFTWVGYQPCGLLGTALEIMLVNQPFEMVNSVVSSGVLDLVTAMLAHDITLE